MGQFDRAPGRPEHPQAGEIMAEYRKRLGTETRKVSQSKRIDEVLASVALRHPDMKLPSKKTVSSWLSKEKNGPT